MCPGVWHDKNTFTFYRIRPPAKAEWGVPFSAESEARTDGLISTHDIAGCWVCCCPLGCTSLLWTEPTSEDSIVRKGCNCWGPIWKPFEEHLSREPGTNGFHIMGSLDPPSGRGETYSDNGNGLGDGGCVRHKKIAK